MDEGESDRSISSSLPMSHKLIQEIEMEQGTTGEMEQRTNLLGGKSDRTRVVGVTEKWIEERV